MTKQNFEAMKKRYQEQYELYSVMCQTTNSERSKEYFINEMERLQIRIAEVDSWIFHELYIKPESYSRKNRLDLD